MRQLGHARTSNVITDALLALTGLACAAVVLSGGATPAVSLPRLAMVAAFVLTAVSAVTGIAMHAAGQGSRAYVLRQITVLLAGVGISALVAALLLVTFTGSMRAWLFVAAAVELVVWAVWVLLGDGFRRVYVHYVPALVAIAVLALVARDGRISVAASNWMLVATALTLSGGIVQTAERGLTRHLDHNDLAHLIVVAAMLSFLAATLRLPAPLA